MQTSSARCILPATSLELAHDALSMQLQCDPAALALQLQDIACGACWRFLPKKNATVCFHTAHGSLDIPALSIAAFTGTRFVRNVAGSHPAAADAAAPYKCNSVTTSNQPEPDHQLNSKHQPCLLDEPTSDIAFPCNIAQYAHGVLGAATGGQSIWVDSEAAPEAHLLLQMYTGIAPSQMPLTQLLRLVHTCGYMCDVAVIAALPVYLAPSTNTVATSTLLAVLNAALQEGFVDELATPVAAWLSTSDHGHALAEHALQVLAVLQALSPAQCLALACSEPTVADGDKHVSSVAHDATGAVVQAGSAMQALLLLQACLSCPGTCSKASAASMQAAFTAASLHDCAGELMPQWLEQMQQLCGCRRAAIAALHAHALGAGIKQRLQMAPLWQPAVLAEGSRTVICVRVPSSVLHDSAGRSAFVSAQLCGHAARWRVSCSTHINAAGERMLRFAVECQALQQPAARGSSQLRGLIAHRSGADSNPLLLALGAVRGSGLARITKGALQHDLRPEAIVQDTGLVAEVFATNLRLGVQGCSSGPMLEVVLNSQLCTARVAEMFCSADDSINVFMEASLSPVPFCL